MAVIKKEKKIAAEILEGLLQLCLQARIEGREGDEAEEQFVALSMAMDKRGILDALNAFANWAREQEQLDRTHPERYFTNANIRASLRLVK